MVGHHGTGGGMLRHFDKFCTREAIFVNAKIDLIPGRSILLASFRHEFCLILSGRESGKIAYRMCCTATAALALVTASHFSSRWKFRAGVSQARGCHEMKSRSLSAVLSERPRVTIVFRLLPDFVKNRRHLCLRSCVIRQSSSTCVIW